MTLKPAHCEHCSKLLYPHEVAEEWCDICGKATRLVYAPKAKRAA